MVVYGYINISLYNDYLYIYMDYIYGIVHMTITISILPYQELFHQVIPMNLRIYP
jgi:hypothetical protein